MRYKRLTYGIGVVAILSLALVWLTRPADPTQKISELGQAFVAHRESYLELARIFAAKADGSSDVDGFILQMGEQKDLVRFKGEQTVEYPQAIKRMSVRDQHDISRVRELSHSLDIDYIHLEKDDGLLWIVVEGGGTLGADSGFLYFISDKAVRPKLDIIEEIKQEKGWYCFFD